MGELALSIIIPVFDGASFLEEKLTVLKAWAKNVTIPLEVIVVNDGSADATKIILEHFGMSPISYKVINLLVNHGKGFALREGMHYARGDYVAFTDADLPYGLQIFEKMWVIMSKDPTIALLFGSRSHPESKNKKGYGWLRKCGRLFFSLVVKLLVIPDVWDTQCGIKMLRCDLTQLAVERSRVNRFAFDIELFTAARQNNLKYQAVPVMLTHHKASSVRLVKDTLSMLGDIFKVKLRMLQDDYVRH